MVDLKTDFLKEIANIGLGHAATSLSKMTDNARIDISLPEIDILPYDKLISSKTKNFCAVKTGIDGTTRGALIIMFDDATSFWVIDKIMGNPIGTTKIFDEMGVSAIKEFTNIIGGSFLTSLSDFMNYSMMPKLPEIFTGKGAEIKDALKASILKETKDMIHVKTEIYIDKKKIESQIFLILDKESFDMMYKKML